MARIAIQKSGQGVIGKFYYSGSGRTFEIGSFFDTQTTSRENRPDRTGNFNYRLANHNESMSGKQIFKGSKTLALELVTEPIKF